MSELATTSAEVMVLTAPRRFERRTVALEPPTAETGVLRIEACGLCGTDHEQYSGHIPTRHPVVPGHEVIGVVERAGVAALRRWGVAVGQRVAVEVFQSCRRCDACRAGDYRRCEHHGLATMIGFQDADRGPGPGGGYATHLHLGPDVLLLPVPEGLDPVTATLFNPLGAGIRWAVELPGLRRGDTVAILGPGIRGLCAAAAAKAAGAGTVMVTGLGARDAERLALAPSFGADLVVDVERDDPRVALRARAGGLADIVVDVTAKAPAAFAQAVGLARQGGTVVVAGTRGGGGTPGFDPDHIVYKELRVLGALGVDAENYRAAFDLLASERFPFGSVPRRVAGFDTVEGLLRVLAGDGGDVPPVHAVFDPAV